MSRIYKTCVFFYVDGVASFSAKYVSRKVHKVNRKIDIISSRLVGRYLMDPGRAGVEIDELPDIYPSSWQFWD